MRVLLFLLVIGVIGFLFGAGIMHFQKNNGSVSLTVETDQAEAKARKAAEKAKQVGDAIADETRTAVDRVRDRADDPTPSTTTTTTTTEKRVVTPAPEPRREASDNLASPAIAP